ncbi:hypothetical protein [Cohnella soli]|uniref:Secreted protein n=1 Tax=Cohnella soli TaxID=425005 RepID=A0ABW0HXH0_9BACL
MRAKIVYAIVFVLIVGSWAGNIAIDRQYRLPEGGFLNHHIEMDYARGASFELLYVANSDDKKKPVSARIDELPGVLFYPAQVHSRLSHQTIYLLRGYVENIEAGEGTSEQAPFEINAVNVGFSDGTQAHLNIGLIVAYREPWITEEPPFSGSSTSSSSDHTGKATTRMTKAAKLTDVSSRWLDELGSEFRFGIDDGTASLKGTESIAGSLPLELRPNDVLSTHYEFLIPHGTAHALDVYNVLLKQRFEEPDGRKSTQFIFANFLPYPTEADMKAYVRAKRRQAE